MYYTVTERKSVVTSSQRQENCLEKSTRGLCGEIIILCFSIMMVVTQVYKFVKTYQNVCLKNGYLFVCKLYLKVDLKTQVRERRRRRGEGEEADDRDRHINETDGEQGTGAKRDCFIRYISQKR